MKSKLFSILLSVVIFLGLWIGLNFEPTKAQNYVPTESKYLQGSQEVSYPIRAQDVLMDTWKVKEDIAITGFILHDEVAFSEVGDEFSINGTVRVAAVISTSDDPQDYDARRGVVNVAWNTHPTGITGINIADVVMPAGSLWIQVDDGDRVYLYETVDNQVFRSKVYTRPRAIIFYVVR